MAFSGGFVLQNLTWTSMIVGQRAFSCWVEHGCFRQPHSKHVVHLSRGGSLLLPFGWKKSVSSRISFDHRNNSSRTCTQSTHTHWPNLTFAFLVYA